MSILVQRLSLQRIHELTSLEASLEHLVNVHVATLEQNGQVTFLHKIRNQVQLINHAVFTLLRLQDFPTGL